MGGKTNQPLIIVIVAVSKDMERQAQVFRSKNLSLSKLLGFALTAVKKIVQMIFGVRDAVDTNKIV